MEWVAEEDVEERGRGELWMCSEQLKRLREREYRVEEQSQSKEHRIRGDDGLGLVKGE